MYSPWRLDKRQASLKLGPLAAEVDLDRPEFGLDHLKFAGGVIAPARLLGVELPLSEPAGDRLIEAYLRGTDLIATYAEVARPSFRWQIYWRAHAERFPQALVAIEAIVSVQTGLLDSWPQLTLHSALPANGVSLWRAASRDCAEMRCERFEVGPKKTATEGWGCFGFSLPGTPTSYIEMVHPGDFDSSSVEATVIPMHEMKPAAGVSLRHPLFCERLEKGVILRSRVLALFLPEWPTSGTIADIERAFRDEELPLTT